MPINMSSLEGEQFKTTYLASTFEYLLQCQQSKRKIVVLKIYFEKAVDTLDHDAIIQVTRAKVFLNCFCNGLKKFSHLVFFYLA
jgi:hypothetical protein